MAVVEVVDIHKMVMYLEFLVVLVVLVTMELLLEPQVQITTLIDRVILPVVLVETLLMMDMAAVVLVVLVVVVMVVLVVVMVD